MTAVFPRRPTTQSPAVPVGSTPVFVPVSRLSTLATELAELPLGPRADFRQDLRTRLLDEAALRRQVTPAIPAAAIGRLTEQRGARRGRRAAAIGFAAALFAGAATTAAAAETVPGDALYPVKRFTESVRTAVAPGPSGPSTPVAPKPVALQPAALKPAEESRPVQQPPSIEERPAVQRPRSAPIARANPSRPVAPTSARTGRPSGGVPGSDVAGNGPRRSVDSVRRSGATASGSGSSSGGSSAVGTSPTVEAPSVSIPGLSVDRHAASGTGGGIVGDVTESLRGITVRDSLSGR